ncbi:MAG: sulfotransferase [Desulfobacterales bacterium]|nr:sulfotransferase [Desulfobacterales bacterium]
MNSNKPTIRVIHQMARSGGTLIGKCLGCMEGVVLLSEIHPAIINELTAIEQAHAWFNLLTTEDLKSLVKMGHIKFSDAIALIHQRCEENGKILVIRDWTHIDFTGVPYVKNVSYKLTTTNVLSNRFNVIPFAVVRHPIDQWLSLIGLAHMQGDVLNLDSYLYGYRKFAEACQQTGFIRYEDFTRNPAYNMKEMCNHFSITFDSGFISKWSGYSNISGDIYGAGRGNSDIKPLPRREYNQDLINMFENNFDYQQAINILNYNTLKV